MKILATAAALCVALALAGPSPAADKDAKSNKDKIVGVWELTRSEDGSAPIGALVEFTKDGKMIVTVKSGDKTDKIEGTYSIDKDMITSSIKVKDEDKKNTVTIKKLTDKDFVVVNKDGKADEFKKK